MKPRWKTGMQRGIVLLIVLVVIVALSLSAYTFSGMMLAHRHSALLNGKRTQARYFVESGVATIQFYLMQDVWTQEEFGGHFDNPLYFQANVVIPDMDLRSRGGFTVVSPYYDDTGTMSGARFGLEDESARLNLNALLEIDKNSAALAAAAGMLGEAAGSAAGGTEDALDTSSIGRTLLMGLPGMTEDVADAILDWMDSDDEPREYGAELEYYSSLNPPYAPRNGPLQTVEELLLVRGVTPELLFGLDTNRNGLIDAHEMSAAMGVASGASLTGGLAPTTTLQPTTGMMGGTTNTAGLRGWASYLTLYSAEKNVRADGSPRINLNDTDLQGLHDQLLEVLSEEEANFILAYRLYGPMAAGNSQASEEQPASAADLQLDLSQQPRAQFNQVLDLIGARIQIPQENNQGGNSGGQSGGSGGQSGGSGGQSGGSGGQSGGSGGQSGGSSGRGGSSGGQSGGSGGQGGSSGGQGGSSGGQGGSSDQSGDQNRIIQSPFSEDLLSMASYLPTLMDACTVIDTEIIPGRINVNQAPREILLGIPGMTEEIVDEILSARSDQTSLMLSGTSSAPSTNDGTTPGLLSGREHETWLLAEGVVTLDEMKQLIPFLCAGGRVYRAQVVGYFQGGGPSARSEVVIDATGTEPRVLLWRDISHLGRGFPLETLGLDLLQDM